MLARNSDATEGLVKARRMIVRVLHENSIAAEVISPRRTFLISGIQLPPSDPTVPFQMCRRFPIKTAFALTVVTVPADTEAGLDVHTISCTTPPPLLSSWSDPCGVFSETFHLTTSLRQNFTFC
jgi:hypothetical protein